MELTFLNYKNKTLKMVSYKKTVLFLFVICLMFSAKIYAVDSCPEIGAQIFIEPGQTDAEIDQWFNLLNKSGMTVCRIRMFEQYLKKADGTWDYTLFDKAFKAGEKYNVKIFATLFPSAENMTIGGFKFPYSEGHLGQISQYIKNVVIHFQTFKSLYGWVLINEPGTGGYVPQNDFTNQKMQEWKKKQIESTYNSKGYTKLIDFSKEKFLTDYNTWYLNWIALEIAKYDTKSQIHVNNHQIFENVAEYDFPSWRKFLTSLGASAHPSWHFDYFKRSQYACALSANCSLIRSGAGPLPFWLTELQGGNNTYSGNRPFCPTPDEITQWLWTSIGSGAKGIIFWCFNPRSIGDEAGEWALVDFQNNPTDKLLAISKITKCISEKRNIFNNSKPDKPNISILYNRESLWMEKRNQIGSTDEKQYEGKLTGGAMKSALSFYEILLENGINSNFQEMNEFDWTKNDYTGQMVILSGQISLPSKYWDNLRRFVEEGGKLFVEGLTGFYDENMLCLQNTGFPLKDVFGGSLKEVKCIPGDFDMNIIQTLPVHLWKAYIYNVSGKILSQEKDLVTATRNSYGKGETVWIPSMIGLGARRSGNSESLSRLLVSEIDVTCKVKFRFNEQHKGVLMHTLENYKSFVTIIVNKNTEIQKIKLQTPDLTPNVIFASKESSIKNKTVTIYPEETLVIEWK